MFCYCRHNELECPCPAVRGYAQREIPSPGTAATAPTPWLTGFPLEEGANLCHMAVSFSYPSTCATAASAWVSQKVMSMARYSTMAADSPVRACSRWPVAAYSVPRPR